MGGAVLRPGILWQGLGQGPSRCWAPVLPPVERGLGLPPRGAVCKITEGSGGKVCNNQPGRASWLTVLYVRAAEMLSTNLSV